MTIENNLHYFNNVPDGIKTNLPDAARLFEQNDGISTGIVHLARDILARCQLDPDDPILMNAVIGGALTGIEMVSRTDGAFEDLAKIRAERETVSKPWVNPSLPSVAPSIEPARVAWKAAGLRQKFNSQIDMSDYTAE